ncbi:MAG: translation initiation factor IF-3 [Desulfosalsimonadaceae bacterium]
MRIGTNVNGKKWIHSKAGGVGIARKKQGSDTARTNHEIKEKEVRVIDPEGNQLGIIPIQKALASAEEFGLDLVEVSPNATPPVCKIMDYGRFKYQQDKKQQEAKKKQSRIQIKEIKVRPKTDTHDLEVKLDSIRKFVEKKNKVKVTVVFRGREITLTERGRELLDQIAEMASEFAAVEQPPKLEGRAMNMVLGPK